MMMMMSIFIVQFSKDGSFSADIQRVIKNW